MFTRIDTIIPESVKKSGIAPKVAQARRVGVFEEVARSFLPPELSDRFKPLKLSGATLTVACKSSAVAIRLREKEPELLKALEEAGSGIEALRFLLAPWR